MCAFKIDVDQFSWIGGAADDPNDRCLHGHVTIQAGDTLLDDYGTVSATALYLLKSLTRDKIMAPHDIQMVPCCGHFLIANRDLSEVSIIGCDTGMDWSVIHENGGVRLVFPSGTEHWVSQRDYRAEVLQFAEKVEHHYLSCQPKVLPEDTFDYNGYIAFWNEWHRRYDAAAAWTEQEMTYEAVKNGLRIGREIEFGYNGKHYSITNNPTGYWYLCQDTGKESIVIQQICPFKALDDLSEAAGGIVIEGITIRQIFNDLLYDPSELLIF